MGRDCRPPRERTANANTILRLVHTWLHVRAADSFRESVHPYINRPPEGTLLFLELLLERLIRNEEGISSERFRGEREGLIYRLEGIFRVSTAFHFPIEK